MKSSFSLKKTYENYLKSWELKDNKKKFKTHLTLSWFVRKPPIKSVCVQEFDS